MLSMLLLLAAAPQAAEAPAHTLRPATAEELIAAGVLPPRGPENAVQMPMLGDGSVLCGNRPIRATDPDVRNGLMWREDGDPVALYRLLDRRVNGCPDPIVVNYRVPGSNAVGREVGRTPARLPSYTPPSIRVP